MSTMLRRVRPRDRAALGLLVALAAVLVTGASAGADRGADRQAGRLPARPLTWDAVRAMPDGESVVHSELARQRIFQARSRWVHDLLGAQKVSARGGAWLADRGLGAARGRDPLAKTVTLGPDTLRILLVRISFETNRLPNLVTMAPDGDFFLDPHDPDDPLPIDPSPHDKAYFESHLSGLSEYYRFQSGGRLHIESRVLPEGDRDSYKLSDVADYGPGDTGFWTLAGLERLVRDMIAAADEGTQFDGSANLSDYADDRPLTYIIFAHAGSDWQSDIRQDTPNDIPTFFVTLGEAQALVGGGLLSECSVIPETTTQDGYRGSIAAALYHEFGHALGLPDVYDATTGLTSCGVWDLMDSGTNLAATLGYRDPDTGEIVAAAVSGILPPSLSVWCKWFLGWVDTALIEGGDGQDLALPAVSVPRAHYPLHDGLPGYTFTPDLPQALQGGASSREFFLVENRWVPRSVDDTPYDPYDPIRNWGDLYFKTDPATGVVLYLAGDLGTQEGLNTGYYDYFLPDGGLLVWHVDMDRIEAGLEFNTINRYGDGLKLVEADGIQDIGVLDAYVLGWYGSARDVFAPWNSVGYTALFAEGAGVPTSRAHDRAWTGLRLWDIADQAAGHGAVMTLRAAVEPLQAGWPRMLPVIDDPQLTRPLRLDVHSVTPLVGVDGRHLVAALADTAAGGPSHVMLWTTGGEPAYPAVGGLPLGAVAALGSAAVDIPAVLPLGGGDDGLVVAGRDGTVLAWRLASDAPSVAWSTDVADSLLAGPQPIAFGGGVWRLLVIDGEGLGHLLDQDGAPVGEPSALLGGVPQPLLVPLRVLDLADGPAALLVTDAGWRLVPVTVDGFGAAPIDWIGRLREPAQIAVMPRDDGHHVLLYGPSGLQGSWAFDAYGLARNVDGLDPGAALVCEPAVADLDGDGHLDLIAATGRRLFAWHAHGVLHTGYPADLATLFPLPDSLRINGPLVVADLVGGPANELAFATDRGHLVVLDGAARAVRGTPFRFGEVGNAGLALVPREGGRASLALASAGGLLGAPLDRRATPGRLSLHDDRPLAADGPATAAWFGPRGGPRRQGTVGEPRLVTGDGPLAQAEAGVVFYPNPLAGRQLTVRFWSAGAGPAELVIYNLQGEVVTRRQLAATAGLVNEHTIDLDVASGLYVARLTSEREAGRLESQVKTIAVVR